MYLKQVELHGFKSFADRSVIEFMPGVTGIVGPNGCGKSNITDGIRWVLGEKSAKAMRGDKMTDVIFSGSEDRKPLNVAEVTLVFDNEDRYLEYDANEVEITRRIYRDSGESEYLINRQRVRMKDISDLIMDTGLGRDSLSIISQNSINAFVQSKPQDRRGMFEEAAGVAKYKARKRESVAKLERTSANLERVEDITSELERQLGPLKRQKRKAERYLEYTKELQEIEVSVLVKTIRALSGKLSDVNKEIAFLEDTRIKNEASLTLSEQKQAGLDQKMTDLDREVNDLQEQLMHAMNRVNELESQKVEADANRKAMLEGDHRETLERDIAQAKAMLADALAEYNDRVARYDETKAEKDALEEQLTAKEQEKEKLRTEIENINLTLHQQRAQHTQLRDAIENKSGYSRGVRTLLKAKASLPGIRGALGDLISAQEGYETALSIALGGAAQYIVTNNEDNAKDGIAFLKRNRAGRATFLPLNVIKSRAIRGDLHAIAQECPGYQGLMSDFVNYDDDLTDIVMDQVGRVIVCDNIDNATAMSKNTGHRLKIVTVEGDVVNIGGSLTGGAYRNAHNQFSGKHEMERLERDIAALERALGKKRYEQTKVDDESGELRQMYMQKQMSFAKLEIVVTNKYSDLQVAKSEYEGLTHQSVELDDLADGTTTNTLLEELNQIKKERDRLKEDIQAKRAIRLDYVNENEALGATLRELRAAMNMDAKRIADLRVDKTKYEADIQNDLTRLNESYQMTYDHAQEFVNEEIDPEEARERVNELRHKINALGHVNVEAIEEYKNVSERYETLNASRQELIAAQDALMKAISEMDEIMVERFTKTFDAINIEFNRVFRYLFGGGHAKLFYSDPDNVLETGIEIEAQPPGKMAKLHSFSGGENALIALSCLFAIMSVRTVPLCILDEVEAALDPANVERFAKYLKEYDDKTQFIVVTHREGTMAECDLLYGATMQQKGVTKLVSVKLETAAEMAAA